MLALSLASLILLFVDATSGVLASTRVVLSTLLSPLEYASGVVRSLDDYIDALLLSPGAQLAERRALNREIVSLRARISELEIVRIENDRLRSLLGGMQRHERNVVVADVVALSAGPGGSLVTINVGEVHSVSVGDPVVDSNGLCGQIVSTGLTTAQVLVVTDPSHSVPVVIERTGAQGIVSGRGTDGFVELEGVAEIADVQVGDVMVTSGLGGRFPYGYPVAEVVSFVLDEARLGMKVYAEPLADPVISRHLIVLRSQDG